MKIINGVHPFENIEIDFKFTLPKRDRRHLIVVFSGGFIGGYDFDGSSFTRIGCAILWIRDKQNSYYIQKNGNDVYERAVQDLVKKMSADFGVDKNEITFLGTSKGGAAALYHGLKYEFVNIVASVPRIHPARGNIDSRPEIVEGILGSIDESKMNEFDGRITNLIDNSNPKKNLYILTSPQDEQYATEIQPNLNRFRRFTNFNYIETSSTNVRQHEDVTLYNLPLISSILSMLVDGIAPSFGEVKNGNHSRSDYSNRKRIPHLESVPIASIESLDLTDSGLYLRGRGFHMYSNASDYADVRRRLILSSPSQNEKYTIQLGGLKDRRNNRDFEDGTGFDYIAGSYATLGNKPHSLDSLPFGKYAAALEIAQNGKKTMCSEIEGKDVSFFRAINDYVVQVELHANSFHISKLPLMDVNEHENSVFFNEFTILDNKLFLRGTCIIKHGSTPNWKDIQFKLILRDSTGKHPTMNVNLGKSKGVQPEFPWRTSNVDSFTTPQNSGISLESIPDGKYLLFLACSINGFTFIANPHRLLVSQKNLFTLNTAFDYTSI